MEEWGKKISKTTKTIFTYWGDVDKNRCVEIDNTNVMEHFHPHLHRNIKRILHLAHGESIKMLITFVPLVCLFVVLFLCVLASHSVLSISLARSLPLLSFSHLSAGYDETRRSIQYIIGGRQPIRMKVKSENN